MASSNTRTNGTSKADFVRRFPPDTPAERIVREATKQGIKLSSQYVYRIRTLDRERQATNGSSRPASKGGTSGARRGNRLQARSTSAKKRRATAKKRTATTKKRTATTKKRTATTKKRTATAKKRTATAKPATAKKRTATAAAEQEFIDLVLELGLERSQQLLDHVRKRIGEVLG